MKKEGGKKDIGITELAQMKETRLNNIRILKNEKQRVLLKLERHQVNKLFDGNQPKFFKVLRDILKDDESEAPLYKKPNTRPETSTRLGHWPFWANFPFFWNCEQVLQNFRTWCKKLCETSFVTLIQSKKVKFRGM